MDRPLPRRGLALVACALILTLAACAGSPLTPAESTTASAPVYDAWTTPAPAGTTYAAPRARTEALQPAPVAVDTTAGGTSAWQPQDRPRTWTGTGRPPPPPLPGQAQPVADGSTTTVTQPCPPEPCPAPTRTTQRFVVPERTYAGCWPPCNDGISQWHARGVIGRSFYEGTDPAEDCTYFGVDLGRTFCGCWGLDLYWRYNSGRFDRQDPQQGTFKDGGDWHHFGAKITKDFSFGRSSRFYVWTGVGGGFFMTDGYIDDDSGPEVFGELGLGYNISRNWRVRAGVNVHGMDTDVTRRSPADDGSSRWLWIIAPVLELEGSF